MSGVDEVVRNLDRWNSRRRAAIEAFSQTWAGTLEGRAKENALWQDRTSHARQGMFGSVIKRRDEVVILLSHSVQYGLWLELCNDGRYAILKPTMDAAIPEIIRAYRRLWEE